MPNPRQSLGARCETLAAEYLSNKGYRVLRRNYRCRLGEVDLVCQDGETLVFVEVKARTSGVYGLGSEAVGYRKQQKLLAIAALYLADHPDTACRFDVISVRVQGAHASIAHVIDAFP